MTTKEKFDAAVNVIKNLPKDGAYQPSNELSLRFYSYYKQATEGPCQKPKPAFWEVIKKAKWDAWNRLGNMSRTEAMENYVEELKKIVETMSYTDNVASFLVSLDSFYENVPAEDLELLVGPVLQRIRSQPGSPLSGSPLGSRETSPHRVRNNNTSRHITSSLETSPASSHSASPLPPDTDGEDEEFKDTVESAPEQSLKESKVTKCSIGVPQTSGVSKGQQPEKQQTHGKDTSSKDLVNGGPSTSLTNGYRDFANSDVSDEVASDVKLRQQERGRTREKRDDGSRDNAEFLNQIATTVQNLQRDLDRITGRVRSLEGQALKALAPQPEISEGKIQPRWWPLSECSPRMFAILIVWPFVAQGLVSYVQRYRQRKL